MNKKGQSLVIFVIILPFLLMFCCYIIDMSLILYEKNHLDNIGKNIDTYYLKNKDLDIEAYILKNDNKIDNIKITKEENSLIISFEKEIKSIFGNVIGIKKYDIKSNLKIKE